MSTTTTAPTADPDAIDAFAERLFAAGLGALELLNVELGSRLGLYHHLAHGEGHSPAELAAAAGIHERYAQEWLEQQTVAGVLTVDDPIAAPTARRYRLPAAHATVLLERDSEAFMAAFAGFIPVAAAALDAVADAFRAGSGVPYSLYRIHDIQAAWTRPAFLHHLTQTWLPAVPQAHERLVSGTARVCEIGCGEGIAAVQIALAYPGVTVDGYDLDEPSIVVARTEAEAAGVADRVRFELRDAADYAIDGAYDLVFSVEMLHDLPDPVGVLATMRRLRAPGGTVLVIDERAAEAFDPDADEMERLFYACSTLHCLPVGMTEPGSAATGTVIRPDAVRQHAAAAGFSHTEILDVEHPQFRLYLLHD